MTEQLNYTLTPKYNFLLPSKNLQIPQKFMELSLRTIKSVKRKDLELTSPYNISESSSFFDIEREEEFQFIKNKNYNTQLIHLKPLKAETTIIAIDVSNINIGETKKGIICAIRGAIVWKERNRYSYLRIGPFPLHITEKNTVEINQLLKPYIRTRGTSHLTNFISISTKLGNILESWIKNEVSYVSQNCIILWDGSLTAGTSTNPLKNISQTLEISRNHLNIILAFSKNTYLRFLIHQFKKNDNLQVPYLLEICGIPSKIGPLILLGKIYMTKLTNGSYPFRLDIDKKIPNELHIKAIQSLLGNDIVYQSYPESLRLAHILSTFTATEVIALQRFVTKECGLKILSHPNMHRLLFGPFGYGPEED